jgi:hypothetical protein
MIFESSATITITPLYFMGLPMQKAYPGTRLSAHGHDVGGGESNGLTICRVPAIIARHFTPRCHHHLIGAKRSTNIPAPVGTIIIL